MVLFTGDNMLKHANGYGLLKSMNHQFKVKSRFHPGAKIRYLNDHIKPKIQSGEADKIVIHVRASNLASDKISMQLCNDIISLAASIQDYNINLIISLIVPHNDDLHEKAGMVNSYLSNICDSILV